MIGTVQDMTDRRRVEHELRVAKQTAEQASRAKTAFLAMMSHEIRTPLNGVLGTLGLLKDTRLDPDQHSLLETALESSEALLTILNDILDFSKMEAGRLDLEPAPFDPWALVSSVFDLTEPLARHKGLTLVKTLAGSLPPALVGDANRIRQILLNLVSNGIKFTESGHILITGSSSIDEDGRRRLRFEIEDTGIGIPRDKQSELFIDFNQLDRSYARKFGGTGLGLAIVRRLVETMNGRMGFMSAPGIGSNFWFEIPLEPATMPAEIREDIIESSASATGQQRLRILVAEDNRTNQLIIKRLLEKQGHHVDVVGNGLEAVAAVGNVPYDCVLMDIAMPEMDGIEATHAIRSLSEPTRSVRIIALTANVMAEDFTAYAAAGMDACIAKPLRMDELNSLLAYMCAPVDPVAVPPPAPADEESTPIIDSEMLGSLQESLEGTTLDEVLNIFVLDIQDRAARIGQAGINGDTKTIRFEVHAMASSARALGAMRLWQHARQVEELCDQGKTDEAFTLVQTIETIARETSDAMSRWMAA
jgi:CheY-like chemotaxis protein/nitrogen-specific signal transduction histidine kinase